MAVVMRIQALYANSRPILNTLLNLNKKTSEIELTKNPKLAFILKKML